MPISVITAENDFTLLFGMRLGPLEPEVVSTKLDPGLLRARPPVLLKICLKKAIIFFQRHQPANFVTFSQSRIGPLMALTFDSATSVTFFSLKTREK